MTRQKDKKVFYGIPISAGGSLWNNPANPYHCVGGVVRGLGECWSGKTGDPIAQQDVDLIFGGQAGDVHLVSLKDRVRDYLFGAGSAINPLHHENADFYESDLEALVSDWDATISDMYTVLRAADFVKNSKYGQSKDDQPIERGEREANSGEIERQRSKAAT